MNAHEINRGVDRVSEDVEDQTTIAAAVEAKSKQWPFGEFSPELGPTVEGGKGYRLSGCFVFFYQRNDDNGKGHDNDNQCGGVTKRVIQRKPAEGDSA